MPGMNPKTGRWARDGEEIAIAVTRACTTPKATRVLRRWLGVERAAVLDRPVAPGMLGPVAAALAESLRAEPRVRMTRIGIDSATTAGAVGLVLEYRVAASGAIGKAPL